MSNLRRKKKKARQARIMTIALSAVFLFITVCAGTAAFLMKDKRDEGQKDTPVLEIPQDKQESELVPELPSEEETIGEVPTEGDSEAEVPSEELIPEELLTVSAEEPVPPDDGEILPETELPYDGAKAMLLVGDVDNRAFLCELVHNMWEELPEKKKRAGK